MPDRKSRKRKGAAAAPAHSKPAKQAHKLGSTAPPIGAKSENTLRKPRKTLHKKSGSSDSAKFPGKASAKPSSKSPVKQTGKQPAKRAAAAPAKPVAKAFRKPADAAAFPADTNPKAAKQARLERKKPVLALVKEVTAFWDQMRPAATPAARKRELAAQIVTVGKGHIKELALNHTSSRAVQAAVKHGAPEARAAVRNECKDHAVELAMSPHGSFVVRKLIATADKAELAALARGVRGSVAKLFRHPSGSAVAADLYDALPAPERNALLAEFYARGHAVLGGPQSAAGKIGSLVDAWGDMDAARRRATMRHLITALAPIIEKAYVDPPAMHRLVSEYLQLAPSDMVEDAVELLVGEATLRMVHTHAGCRAACCVAAYSSAKQRKKMFKAMKGHTMKMALDEFAYAALIKLLSVIDDTQLAQKCAVAELVAGMEELINSPHAGKVVLSLLTGSDKHLPPHTRALLDTPPRTVNVPVATEEAAGNKGDAPAAAAPANAAIEESAQEDRAPAAVEVQAVELGRSKKESAVRRAELLGSGTESFGPAVLRVCAERADAMLRSQQGAQIVAEAACGQGHSLWTAAPEMSQRLHAALCDAVKGSLQNLAAGSAAQGAEPAAAAVDAQKSAEPLVCNIFASRALRRMLLRDGFCAAAADAFAERLWTQAVRGHCKATLNTHAAKVLAALVERATGATRKAIEEELHQAGVADVPAWCATFHVAAHTGGKQGKAKKAKPKLQDPQQ